jgi:hypothetical protein
MRAPVFHLFLQGEERKSMAQVTRRRGAADEPALTGVSEPPFLFSSCFFRKGRGQRLGRNRLNVARLALI